MRGESHRQLGRYLADKYMPNTPERYIRAFLIGCVEPDRNPVTYLKGSLRFQLFRGHNYPNACRFMYRIARRLEKKKRWCLLDYYTLGKLIHYTADAFTFAHNDNFPTDLGEHREYEAALQEHFLRYLQEEPQINPQTARSIMDTIYSYHAEYEKLQANIHIDAKFALNVCCCILAVIFAKSII